jgi:hypothetical protein
MTDMIDRDEFFLRIQKREDGLYRAHMRKDGRRVMSTVWLSIEDMSEVLLHMGVSTKQITDTINNIATRHYQ